MGSIIKECSIVANLDIIIKKSWYLILIRIVQHSFCKFIYILNHIIDLIVNI